MRFFVGLHHPSDAQYFDACCISINSIRARKSWFKAGDWIMDSGAFTELSRHGRFRTSPERYASEIMHWSQNGNLLAAVSQDYMCEDLILLKTGLSIADHQRLTIERYNALKHMDVMPVLQGYKPDDYVCHLTQYGARLRPGMWVGVGSVCKRNGNPKAIEDVLVAIKSKRPDLRLHGFGIKQTALASGLVRELLASADSNAWSYSARKQGRNQHDWREAEKFRLRIENAPYQRVLNFLR